MNNTRPLLLALLTLTACSGVDSDAEAELAYLALDAGVERMLALGFDGFAAADSANIPTQEAEGDDTGLMTVSGQVDQGASDNKGMRLDVVLTDYSDGPVEVPGQEDAEDPVEYQVFYTTADCDPLTIDFTLRDITSDYGVYDVDLTL